MKFNSVLTKKELKLYSSLSSRHGLRKSDLCICEGMKICREVYQLRPDSIVRAFYSGIDKPDNFEQLNLEEISENEMKKISPLANPNGIIFILKRPEEASFSGFEECESYLLILDSIQDPGNLGTIIRTASAFGLKRIFLSKDCADPFSEKVIRAATARQFSLQIIYYDKLHEFCQKLLAAGCRNIFACTVNSGKDIIEEEKLYEKSAIILGNEGHGLKTNLQMKQVTIPMPGGTESLNVAQAATIILYEGFRRKG